MTCTFRQGWVWFERTCIFSGIQFTKHFIEFVFVETNEVVRSDSNVILTRKTCGQRSSRVAGSKRRALAFCFSVRMWYVLLISICRGLQHTAIHCNTLQHSATHCNTHHISICRGLQQTATHCNTLQRSATHCNTLHHISICRGLQHTAIHCNTLQHTATHCIASQ